MHSAVATVQSVIAAYREPPDEPRFADLRHTPGNTSGHTAAPHPDCQQRSAGNDIGACSRAGTNLIGLRAVPGNGTTPKTAKPEPVQLKSLYPFQ